MSNFNLNRVIKHTVKLSPISNTKNIPVKEKNISYITLEQVNASLQSYKNSTYYISFLETQIKNNRASILQNGYSSLRPLLEKQFPHPGNYCWIVSLPNNRNNATIELHYSTKYGFLQGQKVMNLTNMLPNLRDDSINVLQYYYTSIQNANKSFYDLSVHNFVDGPQLYMNLFIRDVRNPSQWIVLGSAVHLTNIIPTPIPSNYFNFVYGLKSLINNLGEPNIFEYGSNFETLKCISSVKYPTWSGKLISKCFIPGSNENTPLTFKNIISEILSYPTLEVNQKCIVSYKKNNEYFVSVINLIKNNQFVERSINLNNFFLYANTYGDKILTGGYKINGFKGNTVVDVDTTTNITCFNEKVGINQSPFEVIAMLDIDTNTQQQITIINTTIQRSFLLLNQKIATMKVNGVITYSNPGNFTAFTCPIKSNITRSDINMLNRAINMDNDSFLKIQTISHELFYNNPVLNQLYTFIEIIIDGVNKYLAVMIGFVSYINNVQSMTFLVILTNINYILNDNSLSTRFIKIISQYSGLNRSLNYAVSLFTQTNITSSLLQSNNTNFTNKINDSIIPRFGKFYCFSIHADSTTNKYLFNEEYTQWNNKPIKNLFIGDYKMSTIINTILSSYTSIYGHLSLQTTLIDYMWPTGLKIVFANQINIGVEKYMLCVEINASDFLVPSIHCRGDNILSGNFTIQDESKNTIFQIDNYKKNIKNMYNVGIGTPFPNSPLDVKDFGLDDIKKLIDDVSKSDLYTNQILSRLKQINMANSNEVKQIFNGILQTNEMYYVVREFPNNNVNNVVYKYNWLYPELENKPFSQLINKHPNIDNLLSTIKSNSTELLTSYLFDGCMREIQYTWVFGIKRTGFFFFVNNSVLYALCIGKNTQSYNLKMNTNTNIQNFYNCENAYSHYLQSIIYKNTSPLVQRNMNILTHSIIISQRSYPMTTYTCYIVGENDATVSIYSFDTNQLLSTNIISEMDFNNRSRYLSFVFKYKKYYNTLETGYGMLHFEDINFNYISQFYKNGNIIYSVEFCVETYLNPTVDITGDVKIQGNLVVYDKYNSLQYTTIDPCNKYVGINTDDRTIIYNKNYSTTSYKDSELANHHVYIRNNTYPNIVCERENDNSTLNQTEYSSFSALTMKRNSGKNTFATMLDNTNTYTSGVGKNMYGVDISFEMSDKTHITQEIGNLIMGIDSIDETGTVRAGFSVAVQDPNNITRNILHVDNSGCLSVNSINIKNKIIDVENGQLIITPNVNTHDKMITKNVESVQTQYPFIVRNETKDLIKHAYILQLPVVDYSYIFSLQLTVEYTEYAINTSADSYFFKSHFTYDSETIKNGILNMPFTPTTYSCGKSENSKINFYIEYTNNTINLTILLPSNMYMVATLNALISQISPEDKRFSDMFKFDITKTL